MDGLSQTQLGPVWLAAVDQGLIAVEIGMQLEDFTQKLAAQFGAIPTNQTIQLPICRRQIVDYLRGARRSFDFPIHWGLLSAFQQNVLRTVAAIPYGETRTYGQIAAQIGSPQAPRAVGRANATNPMPLVIPCHRLIGADGSLRGYGSGQGIATKRWLIDLEKQNRS